MTSLFHRTTTSTRRALSAPSSERGSLALEQVLFIGAVIGMSVGIFAFYDSISNYFKNVNLSNVPTTVTTAGSSSGSSGSANQPQ